MSYKPLNANDDNEDDYEDDKVRPSFEGQRQTVECRSSARRKCGRGYSLILPVLISNVLLLTVVAMLSVVLRRSILPPSNVTEEVVHGFYGYDTRYMSLEHVYDYLWASESEGNNGLIHLPPYDGETKNFGNIGMFHQLHCLTSFRAALQRAGEGEFIGIDAHDDSHWPHCLYYMRQAILCSADDLIELPRYWNGSLGGKVISGEWDKRTCGDADKLFALRRKHGIDQH